MPEADHTMRAGGEARYSVCGVGWGIAGQVAADSEGLRRHLGVLRSKRAARISERWMQPWTGD